MSYVQKNRVMIFGADVNHARVGSTRPSFAAVTGSLGALFSHARALHISASIDRLIDPLIDYTIRSINQSNNQSNPAF